MVPYERNFKVRTLFGFLQKSNHTIQIQNLFSTEIFTPRRPVKSAIVGRRATVLIYDLFKLLFCRLILLVKSRAFHKLLGNFLATSRISRNFVRFEQLLAMGGGGRGHKAVQTKEQGTRFPCVLCCLYYPFPQFFSNACMCRLATEKKNFCCRCFSIVCSFTS